MSNIPDSTTYDRNREPLHVRVQLHSLTTGSDAWVVGAIRSDPDEPSGTTLATSDQIRLERGATDRSNLFEDSSTSGAGTFPAERRLNLNSALISDVVGERRKALSRIRESLLRKKYKNDKKLTDNEARHLAFVTWQIERIDYAKVASDLGALSQLADLHERLARKVDDFIGTVNSIITTKKKR